MPLPKITDAIINASKTLNPGWSLLTLLAPPRAQPAKPGKKGVNYFFEFEAQAGPGNTEENKGRHITLMISGAGLDAGIAEVCDAYYGTMSGLTGLAGKDIVGKDIPDEAIVGKSIWVDVDFRVNEGKKYPEFKQISPSDVIPF